MVYLDHAATSPVAPNVKSQLEALDDSWGNPGGLYQVGRTARALLDASRGEIASLLDAKPEEIYFTSGGTESDNWAIYGAALTFSEKRHIITSQIEHHAVLNPCRRLEQLGYRVTYLPVDGDGRVDPQSVSDAISNDTCLISIMMANNEIGTVEPIREIGEIAQSHHVLFHTDAVQAIGQIPVSFHDLPVDLLSFSGHKFGAFKGTGALLIKSGTRFESLLLGGAQEREMRSGTENVLGITSMAKALEQNKECFDAEKIIQLRNWFISKVQDAFPDVKLNGDRTNRLPGNIHFSVPGISSSSLITQLDMAGIAASAGSACTSGMIEPSHVLLATGGDLDAASLRLTMGYETTMDDMEYTFTALKKILSRRKGIHT